MRPSNTTSAPHRAAPSAISRPSPPAGAVDDMLWNETALGRLLRRFAARGAGSNDAAMRFFANDSLVPRQLRDG